MSKVENLNVGDKVFIMVNEHKKLCTVERVTKNIHIRKRNTIPPHKWLGYWFKHRIYSTCYRKGHYKTWQ